MSKQITIALDAMGGDKGIATIMSSAIHTLQEKSNLHLILVGDEEQIKSRLVNVDAKIKQRITVKHATQVVGMDELPAQALRNKKDSSMRVAINLVKKGDADACVSAGNTGALMATARFVLKMLPGIDRPAIISILPTIKGHTHVLDLGANVDCSEQHLLQFGIMGSELVTAVDGNKHPTVGLLNIGEESIKGNEQVKKAASLLQNSALNYIGFVEGDGIYKGDADVVVCDGFVGNVALKSSEGVAKMIGHFIKMEFNHSIFTKIAALFAMPVLSRLRKRIDPRRYNGASLLGLRGIVIKSHGGADALAFSNAIQIAMIEVAHSVPDKISKSLEQIVGDK